MQLKNNKGAALITVLIALVVLSILGIALMSTALADGKQAIYQQDKIQSNYLARSAVDDIASHIIATHNAPSISLPTTKSFDFGDYTVTKLQASHSNTVFYIEATGKVNGTSSTVGLTVSKDNPSDLFDKAIYTFDDLNIELMNVSGDIASAGTIKYATNGSTEYDTDLWKAYPGATLELEYTVFPIDTDYMDLSNNNLSLSGEFTISSDTSYNNVSVPNGSTLRFVVTDGNTLIVGINNLSSGNSGSIIVEGGGLLKLYIYNTFESKGDFHVEDGSELELMVYKNALVELQTPLSFNPNEDPNKVRIYLDEDSTLSLQANGNYNAYIHGPEAFIEMQSSQTTVNGAIIGNILQGNGNKPMGVVNYKKPDDSWSLYQAAFSKRFYQ